MIFLQRQCIAFFSQAVLQPTVFFRQSRRQQKMQPQRSPFFLQPASLLATCSAYSRLLHPNIILVTCSHYRTEICMGLISTKGLVFQCDILNDVHQPNVAAFLFHLEFIVLTMYYLFIVRTGYYRGLYRRNIVGQKSNCNFASENLYLQPHIYYSYLVVFL